MSLSSFFSNLRAAVTPVAATLPAAKPAPAPRFVPRDWKSLKWGYQLQNVVPRDVANSAHDYMVIDWTQDGKTLWPRASLDIMKRKKDGTRRIMLAYVSIGEAENYRSYWQGWAPGRPSFVLPKNPEWPDNYPVKFEEPAWKDIVYSMIQACVTAGFDGVYLDKVDVYNDRKMGQRGALLMMEFVETISKKFKAIQPGFLIFPQNSDELLIDQDYRHAIDGIGREDLLYGEDGEDGVSNDSDSTRDGINHLRLLARDGKPVLAVEYYGKSLSAALARHHLLDVRIDTLIACSTDRQLSTLPS